MSTMLFPASLPALPVVGEDGLYPVNRIFCVARNYAAHAREMGADPQRDPPFYFTKSPSALLVGGGIMPYPPATHNLHHEAELVVALGTSAHQVTPDQAAECIFGYAVGLDMTRRDLQFLARDNGRPWDLAKSFEYSAPISALHRRQDVLKQSAITLQVNDQIRQRGDLSDMIWSVPEIIAHLSQFYHLQPGDIIFTGTPEGVSPVVPGDLLTATIDGLDTLTVTIGEPLS